MKAIRNLVTVLAISFLFSSLSGVFNVLTNLNSLFGLIDIVIVIWLLVLVYKKPSGRQV